MITLLRLAGASGLAVLLVGAALLGPLASPAHAQGRNVPNALQGFSANRDQPIRINANSLEVLDQQKKAIFSGNVIVVQGDTTLRCKELVVHYETKDSGDAKNGAKGGVPASGEALAAGSPINSSAIRRLDINGSVVVTTKQQTATGDNGQFETASNTITLNGNPVVLTSGPNVIRGKKLTVDLASGMSRFDGGRIESLIVPNSMSNQDLPGGPGAGGKPAPKPAP